MLLQRGLTYLGAIAKGDSPEKAAEIANSAVTNILGLSEGPSAGKRHLLQVHSPSPCIIRLKFGCFL